MAETTRQARARVVEARAQLATELDDLGDSARRAFDIPTKVKDDPVRTVGLAGAGVFLLVGGPQKLARRVVRQIRGGPPKVKGLLPREIERTIDELGPRDKEQIKAKLEREFARYLADKKKKGTTEPHAEQSFWRLFDIMSAPLGLQAARKIADRLLSTDPHKPDTAAMAAPSPTLTNPTGRGETAGQSRR